MTSGVRGGLGIFLAGWKSTPCDADFRVRRARFWSDECARKLKEVRRRWDGEGRMGGFCEDRKADEEVLGNGGGWV